MINADVAWDAGVAGSGQAVAILDTGVDKTHEFLSGKVIAEACFSTDYPTILAAGPTENSAGGLAFGVQEAAPDDYWLDHWSPGRTVGITSISDINNDGFRDIASLKGGPNGATDMFPKIPSILSSSPEN